jgi:energy-coupling factor transporter ATP-binding protein EcfA2
MVKTKLIMVEGLPGSGKSTTAQLINDILKENNINPRLYLEGNVDHPADYEFASFFTKNEFTKLLAEHTSFQDQLLKQAEVLPEGYVLYRPKLTEEIGAAAMTESLQATLWEHDLYELPLEINMNLITEKWKRFCASSLDGDDTYIFECCFIQNPVTIGMIKYGASEELILKYVEGLAAAIKPLNPILVYVNQKDLSLSFKKAVKERPEEWANGFMGYYTNQGYGKKQGATGLEGTITVLKARQQLESKIYDSLKMTKFKLDNTEFNLALHKARLVDMLAFNRKIHS